jgi:hypothetical protein
MAKRLGVPLRIIQKDLAELDLAFQKMEAAKEFRLTLKRRQAAEIDRQVGACRQHYKALEEVWERSKKDKESSRARQVTVSSGKDGEASVGTETQADQEGRLGDPSYQKLMLDNDKHIADLMDLYPPKERRHKAGADSDNQTPAPVKVESLKEVADAVNIVLDAVFGPTLRYCQTVLAIRGFPRSPTRSRRFFFYMTTGPKGCSAAPPAAQKRPLS